LGIYSLGFSDTYAPEMYGGGQETARMNNRQRRSDMTETDITSPKGDIEGSRRRALIDIQINMKGGR
jgi:hypothetical protein